MPLPVLTKTWQFNVNQTITATGTVLTNNRNLMLALKNSLKGFATLPWTVRYSCDSVAAGSAGDEVDRWDTNTDLVWSTGAHSWIILRQTGIASNFELCIDLNRSSSGGTTLDIVISPAAAFTGGTTTARPTAADEAALLTNAAWGGHAVDNDQRLHAMQSTDGQSTRILMHDNSVCKGYWMFEKPANVVTGWTNPSASLILGASTTTNIVTAANLHTNANGRGRGSATMNLVFSSEGRGTSPLFNVFTVPNDLSGEYPLLPIGIASETASNRGRHGTVNDLWYGLSNLLEGDTYPNDVTRQFMQSGILVHPWNGSVPGIV